MALVSLVFGALAPVSFCNAAEAGDRPGFVVLEDSGIDCGAAIPSKEVLLIDVEGQLTDEKALDQRLKSEVGGYTLVSSQPILIPKLFEDGKTRRQFMVNSAARAVADIGCNLVVLLGVEFVDKQWENPASARVGTKRWVTMGYALVLVGTH